MSKKTPKRKSLVTPTLGGDDEENIERDNKEIQNQLAKFKAATGQTPTSFKTDMSGNVTNVTVPGGLPGLPPRPPFRPLVIPQRKPPNPNYWRNRIILAIVVALIGIFVATQLFGNSDDIVLPPITPGPGDNPDTPSCDSITDLDACQNNEKCEVVDDKCQDIETSGTSGFRVFTITVYVCISAYVAYAWLLPLYSKYKLSERDIEIEKLAKEAGLSVDEYKNTEKGNQIVNRLKNDLEIAELNEKLRTVRKDKPI